MALEDTGTRCLSAFSTWGPAHVRLKAQKPEDEGPAVDASGSAAVDAERGSDVHASCSHSFKKAAPDSLSYHYPSHCLNIDGNSGNCHGSCNEAGIPTEVTLQIDEAFVHPGLEVLC